MKIIDFKIEEMIRLKYALRNYDYLKGFIDGLKYLGTSFDLFKEWCDEIYRVSDNNSFAFKEISPTNEDDDYMDFNYKEMCLTVKKTENGGIELSDSVELYDKYEECLGCYPYDELKEKLFNYEKEHGVIHLDIGFITKDSQGAYIYISKKGRRYDLLEGKDSVDKTSDIVFIFDYGASEGGAVVDHMFGGFNDLDELCIYCSSKVDEYEGKLK